MNYFPIQMTPRGVIARFAHRSILTTSIVIILVLLLGLFVPGAAAQADIEFDPAADGDRSPSVRDAEFPRLSLTLTPLSNSGVPISGLAVEDFTITEDGTPIEEFTLTERTDPAQGISVLLVLDVSGSMRDDIDDLRVAAATLYDQVLEQSDESAIITFANLEDGSTVNLSDPFPQLTQGREEDFTNDEGRLKNLINGLIINENDGTPLYDAIYKGARMANENANNSRRVVIVMSDGVDADRAGNEDQGSAIYDRDSVIDEIRTLNVPIFTVGLGDEIDSAFLQRVANATGGTYQNTPSADNLATIFTDVARQLKIKYDLTFDSSILSDGELHNLQIVARTPLGQVSSTVTLLAHYPVEPWVQGVQAANPRQDLRSLTTFESVKGLVALQPRVVARGNIAKVEYYVDDVLVYTADASPWGFSWNTTDLTPNQTHQLRIEAHDDADPANIGRTEFALLVEECSVICLLEQQSGIPVIYWLIGLLALLLLLIFFMLLRRRRTASVYDAPYYPPISEPFTPAPTPSQHEPLRPTLSTEATASAFPIAGVRPKPKTEVLRREPERLAFLIDRETGRQFPLNEGTTIGSGPENDIVLDEAAVSAKHGKIRLENGTFALFDLGSTNGTLVNGRPITRHELSDGDRVQLGRKILIFKRINE